MAVAFDKFVGLVRESGLIPPEELDALLAEIPAARKADGEQLARELVKRKKLTAYQAQEVYGGRGKKLVLGNYVIQDKLGQGGMGMVLKAEHRRMERVVALKVMSKAAVESPEAVKRFHREVKAAAKLNHPNIVTAFDADEAGGTHFLVMEFVEGTDLSQLVKKNGPLPVEKAITCILQAARGLEFAHEHGIVHRDIKPANLLLDAKGNVKILDMGLARIESVGGEQAELTGTGQIMGTVDYMAPEQAMNTRKADHRADIYSLGISLWYLLTGKVAYGGETVMEKLMAHQTHPIPSLADAGVAVSPALEAVFRKMVAKTAGERYQSTSEVVAALERCKTSRGDVSPTVNLGPSEDAKLSDFLKGGVGVPLSGGSSRPAVAVAPPLAPSTGAGPDVTIVTNTPQADTDPQTQTSLLPVSPLGAKPFYSDPRVVALGGGALGVALLAGLLYWLTSGPNPDPGPPLPHHVAPTPPLYSGRNPPPVATSPFDGAKAAEHQRAWAAYLGLPVEREIDLPKGAKLAMVLIPPGEFQMGSAASEQAQALEATKSSMDQFATDRIATEGPVHSVTISRPFYLGKHELTRAQWQAVMGTAPPGNGEEGLPVTGVSWDDVQPLLDKLNAGRRPEDGRFALPTEAQWEFACRAGTSTCWHCGNSERDLSPYAWTFEISQGKPHAVGALKANAWSLHDMHGNMWEWCRDWYGPGYYAESLAADPPGPATGSGRVLRGGSWLSFATFSRSAYRYFHLATDRRDYIGLRLLLEIEQREPTLPGSRGLAFDGVSSHVLLPASLKLPTGPPITIEAIVTPRTAEQRGLIVISPEHQHGTLFALNGAWIGRGWVPGAANYVESSAKIETSQVGRKVHLAQCWNQGYGNLFVNGHLAAKVAPPTPFEANNQKGVAIGAAVAPDGKPTWVFDGTIHQVRISTAYRYKEPFAPPTTMALDAPTLALYNFDEGTGDVLHDASPHKHDGKIVGAKWVRADASSSDGFVPLFNGQNLAGWKNAGTNWRVEQGLLVGSGQAAATQGGSFLLSERGDYTDFRLRVEARVGRNTSAGIGGRMQADPNGAPLGQGYVAKINADSTVDGRRTGSLYVLDAEGFADGNTVTPSPVPADEWLRLEMTVQDNRVHVEVNGQPTTDYRDPKRRFASGHIALQLHSGENRVEFRKIEIKEFNTPARGIAPFNATEARAHQDAWARHLGVPVEWENSLGMKFVLIPPGEFLMGSTPAEIAAALKQIKPTDAPWRDCINSEAQRHTVILTRPIYAGIHEVTQAQYLKIMGRNPAYFARTGGGKNAVGVRDTAAHPVEMVSWNDAAEFCAKLSQQEKLKPCYSRTGETSLPVAGDGYRLPTEAEWEYACRAGTTSKYWIGDTDAGLAGAGWFGTNSGGRTHAVGELKANPFGLFDTHGNTWEWVEDWWEAGYYGRSSVDPKCEASGSARRLIRGGNCYHEASYCRSSGRHAIDPTSRLDYLGFRVALPIEAVKRAIKDQVSSGNPGALQFDGVDDYVELPQLPAMPPGAILTVEAWATLDQPLAFRDGRCLFELGPMHVGAGGAPEGHERWIAAVLAPKFSPLPINERAVLGRRTHIAVVLDPQGMVEYVDGKEALRKTYQDFGWAARDFWVNSLLAKKLLVGRGNGPPGTSPKYWPGTIDELRISTSRRYAANFTPKPRFEPDADTLALYHFDEGQGEVLTDASSNKRHGKVSGAKWVALPSSASTVMGPWHSLIEELAGWRQVEPRQPLTWSLENREFVSGSTASSSLFLYEIEKFADFDLRAELQFADGADAGILFHVPNSRIDGGWEVEIGNLNRFTGDVVNVTDAQRNKIVSAPGEWHLLEISVRGQHCAVKVNGQTTATATLPTSRYPPPGMIALQGGAKPVRFRKLEVRLPSPEQELASTPQRWLRFNGKGDHVRIPSVSYDGEGPFTIEAWARVDPGRDSMHVLYLPGDHSLLLNFAWRTWCAAKFLNGPTGVVAHAQTRPNANAWYHLAAVWDGRQLQFFVNGKLQQGKVHGFNGKQVGDVFYIGGEPPAVNGGDNSFFPGDIGPVRVSRSQRYQAQFAPPVRFTPDVDTVAIYNLDEGQGDILRDSSGHKHDGKIVGAQWMRTGSPPPPVENYELDLAPGGVRGNARVQLPNRRNDGPMTVELFVRPRSLAKGNQAVFSAHRVDLKQFDDHWAFVVTTPDFAKYDRILTPGVVAGRRTHLACTLNGQTITLFVDGKPAGTRIFADRLGADAVPWTLGRGAPFAENWSSLEGTIDEIRISDGVRYDRAFTPVERLTADAQTWALYHCDEGSGEILWDNSGQWRDGKVIGAKWVRAGATVAPVPAPPIPAAPQPAAVPFDALEAKEHQAAWAKELMIEVETPNSVGMKMVVIPPGRFTMGRSPRDGEVLQGEKLPDDDLPRHSVTLTKPFAIAATEVTQKQWKEVMGTTPWTGKKQVVEDPDRPATYVSWKDAIAFCTRLSEKEKAAYRLPTEAEWEWACRAGTETTFNFGDDVKELYDHAWARFNSQDLPHPVAQKNPNEFGLFDMHGNAWEWADDVYGPYSAETAVDPRAQAAGNKRTLRGGCFWSVPIADYRSSARREWPEGLGYSESGFRPVRTLDTRLEPGQGTP